MKIIYDLKKINLAIEQISDYLDSQKERIVCLYGEMGSGKTTIIKHLMHKWRCLNEITSPSFNIINEYQTDRGIVFHFDFYRIENLQEAIDIGFFDYLDSGSFCFIEWPEKVEELLPQNKIILQIEIINETIRKLQILKNQKNDTN